MFVQNQPFSLQVDVWWLKCRNDPATTIISAEQPELVHLGYIYNATSVPFSVTYFNNSIVAIYVTTV